MAKKQPQHKPAQKAESKLSTEERNDGVSSERAESSRSGSSLSGREPLLEKETSAFFEQGESGTYAGGPADDWLLHDEPLEVRAARRKLQLERRARYQKMVGWVLGGAATFATLAWLSQGFRPQAVRPIAKIQALSEMPPAPTGKPSQLKSNAHRTISSGSAATHTPAKLILPAVKAAEPEPRASGRLKASTKAGSLPNPEPSAGVAGMGSVSVRQPPPRTAPSGEAPAANSGEDPAKSRSVRVGTQAPGPASAAPAKTAAPLKKSPYESAPTD